MSHVRARTRGGVAGCRGSERIVNFFFSGRLRRLSPPRAYIREGVDSDKTFYWKMKEARVEGNKKCGLEVFFFPPNGEDDKWRRCILIPIYRTKLFFGAINSSNCFFS